MKEGAEPSRLVLKRSAGTSGRGGQSAQGRGGKMGQRVLLEIRPHIFHRIEFGGVRWEVFQIKTEMGVEEEFDLPSQVGARAIPEDQQVSPQLAEQLAEEVEGAIRIDVFVGMQPEVEVQSVAGGSGREGANTRDLLIGSAALVENGGVAARGSGRQTSGAIRKPVSSRKIRWAFRRWAFF